MLRLALCARSLALSLSSCVVGLALLLLSRTPPAPAAAALSCAGLIDKLSNSCCGGCCCCSSSLSLSRCLCFSCFLLLLNLNIDFIGLRCSCCFQLLSAKLTIFYCTCLGQKLINTEKNKLNIFLALDASLFVAVAPFRLWHRLKNRSNNNNNRRGKARFKSTKPATTIK